MAVRITILGCSGSVVGPDSPASGYLLTAPDTPPLVLDYLCAHEVAHLREMNHSHRFWQLCRALCPQTEQARHWLNTQGPALHAIGAEEAGGLAREAA